MWTPGRLETTAVEANGALKKELRNIEGKYLLLGVRYLLAFVSLQLQADF